MSAADQSDDRQDYRELLRSLERARSYLAIAVAAESKRTPLTRLRYYRETEAGIHRCLRDLRTRTRSGQLMPERWRETLHQLHGMPLGAHGAHKVSARELCDRLRCILEVLDRRDEPDGIGG